MLIKATEKAIKHCALITLQGNGVPIESLGDFVDGKEIEVPQSVAEVLILNELATEESGGQ